MPKKSPPLDERDLELENAIGNYSIAQYQSSRLLDHMVNLLNEKQPDEKGIRRLKSSHLVKHGDRYYKMQLSFREVALNELLDKD